MPPTSVDPAHADARSLPSPPLVALAGWLVPGAGYWLIGQRARALVVGVTILTLFFSGILLGGVRAIQVPGYGEDGGRLYAVVEKRRVSEDRVLVSSTVKEHKVGQETPGGVWVGTHIRMLLPEIGNKPWSICQVMAGPAALASGAWSVWASRPVVHEDKSISPAPGVLSHSRVNEIAVLYTAVAGMLNLLTMIDAAGRADEAMAARSGQHSRLVGAMMFLFRRGGGGGNAARRAR
jgi:hypothetical protein